uniref:ACA9 n=1 Tax=Arundo donax TaxID=35708 RepID=A0A0A8ZEU8_ARUDO
MLLVVLDIL